MPACQQELRHANARSIAAARSRAPEWIDEAGYDLITIPQGATKGHDGAKHRVFTKSDYRKLILPLVGCVGWRRMRVVPPRSRRLCQPQWGDRELVRPILAQSQLVPGLRERRSFLSEGESVIAIVIQD